MSIRRILSFVNMDAFLSYIRPNAVLEKHQVMASTLEYPIMVGVGLEQAEQPNEVEILIAGGLINEELIN